MENASKALIIAGSILLSILIIALGMYIFSTSSQSSDVTVLSESEVTTFNTKFTKYEGGQNGSNVKALLDTLRSNYTQNKESADKIPGIAFAEETETAAQPGNSVDGDRHNTSYVSTITTISNQVEKSHRYFVAFHYNSENGLVDGVGISYDNATVAQNIANTISGENENADQQQQQPQQPQQEI